MKKILSINSGSSSLKFKLFDMPCEELICWGNIERIGLEDAIFAIKTKDKKIKEIMKINNHDEAVNLLIENLSKMKIINDLSEIKGIGHRVVHGGEKFKESVVIDNDTIKAIEDLSSLAPLHNPANITGINTFKKIIPNALAVAVFDTAFHQTMPKEAYIYGTPYSWYEKYGVRKYGFHGTSHKYVSDKVSDILGKKDAKIIVCHLGNGASICAIDSGKSVDTSMGFTPLAGILMGTRCGEIDPAIIPYILNNTDKTTKEVENELNKKSGLFGVSGVSNDSREIEEGINKGDARCKLAQDIFVRRILSYVSSYYVLLGGVDAICFTAGIGENSALTRKQVIDKLSILGIELDEEANNTRGNFKLITKESSKIKCYIVPTNEELMIAKDTYKFLN